MDKILVDIREEHKNIRDIFANKDVVSVDDLLDMIDDLIYEKEELEEKIEEMEEDIKENYELKQIDDFDYYGVSRHDFY